MAESFSTRKTSWATRMIIVMATCQSCEAFTRPSPLVTNQVIHHPSTDVSIAQRQRSLDSRSLGHDSHGGNYGARSTSHLFLFESLLQPKRTGGLANKNNDVQKSRRLQANRIPEEELKKMSDGYGVAVGEGNGSGVPPPPFPYAIDLQPPPAASKNDSEDSTPIVNSRASRLVVRHLEEDDIVKILPEVVREFGALISSSSQTPKQPGDEVATQIENYLFSLTVLLGLTQRVERRKKGYPGDDNATSTNKNIPDHNVICLVEQIPITSSNQNDEGAAVTTSYSEQIVGIGELSWQPPNPNRNAPPFVLPYFMKSLFSRLNPAVATSADGSSNTMINTPRGYISNVLVYKSRRGKGYGRLLMAALEGIARIWQCEDVRLHVDASEVSGKAAQELYWSLGYICVPDRGAKKRGGGDDKNRVGFEWMGPSMANQGLYMVDGIPLLYLCKSMEWGSEQVV